MCSILYCFFFFNDPATTEIYTLSLHDALPISTSCRRAEHFTHPIGVTTVSLRRFPMSSPGTCRTTDAPKLDRKSTRLNSSHPSISYAVFCLKKKKKNTKITRTLIKQCIVTDLQ